MSFLVIDNDFNRQWNRELIGLRFTTPPSYTAVIECNGKPDFLDYGAWKSGLKVI